METAKLLAVSVTGALCALLLRRSRPEFAAVLGVLTGGAVLAALFTACEPLFSLLSALADAVPGGDEFLTVLLKASGAALLSALASDICLDCGEHALSAVSLSVGRIGVLLISLPIFTSLAEVSITILRRLA